MTEYLTEQEQVELLKNWIKQYSLVILLGVALAFATITGWRYWQARQIRILSHASAIYDDMLAMRAQNDAKNIAIQAEKLFTHYPQTIYGQFAALMLARNAISDNKYNEAEKKLQWVIDHSKVKSIRQIARLRLGRLLINEQKPAAGLQLLNTVDDRYFAGLTDEIRGDAYEAMDNPLQARAAYKKALAELPNAEVIRPLLKMKFDNLATNTSQS